MGRPKAPENTEQVTVRLRRSTANRLRKDPGGIGKGISNRLDASILDERVGSETRMLLAAIKWIAEELEHQSSTGWQTNERTRLALVTAIQTWMESQPLLSASSQAVADLFGPNDPSTVGRTVARTYGRIQDEDSKIRRELKARQAKGQKR